MTYELNEKKYRIRVIKEMTFEDLKEFFTKVYKDMCEFHGKKITDHKHYINYMRKLHGYALSTADAKEIIRLSN